MAEEMMWASSAPPRTREKKDLAERGPGRRPKEVIDRLLPALFLLFALFPGSVRAGCLDCHQIALSDPSWQSVHEPFQRGQCFSCHQEHGEKGELLLVTEGNALCARCHDTGSDTFTGSHRRMTVGKLACGGCHQPHVSGKRNLLRQDIHRPLADGECDDCHRENGELTARTTALLCFRCHNSRAFEGVSRHEPAADRDCTGCHDPHGSGHPRNLASAYPLQRYAFFSEETYGACFSCHEVSSFTVRSSAAETSFKNQQVNLHYLHTVKKGESSTGAATWGGITCRNCHQPHASLQRHLVRENLDCGEGVLCLKLAYFIKDGTATCRAGCHESASYRSTPGDMNVPMLPTTGVGPAPPKQVPLCLECHRSLAERFRRKRVHEPVRKQRCGECHGDHGDTFRLVLGVPRETLCSRCHEEESGAMDEAHGGLGVAGKDCLACHDPHASDGIALLRTVAHEPFRERSCGDCHEEESGSWIISRPVSEVCGDCHDEEVGQSARHGALGKVACTGCHDPHAAAFGRMLVEDVPGLCYRCHDRKDFSLQSRHEPVEQGQCDTCHAVHGGKEQLLVAEKGKKLCLLCHNAAEDTFMVAHNRLAVEKIACASCHLSHTSERKGLLRLNIHRPLAEGLCRDCHREGGGLMAGTTSLLCFRCHRATSFQGVSGHEPAAEGDCTDCHDPHGSEEHALLASPYPVDRYTSFSEETYGLCFSCHESSSFTVEGPGAETGFKDLRDNLHYRHVVKQGTPTLAGVTRQGITCRTCHLPHDSLRPHLIRQNLDCGGGVLCLKLAYFVRDGTATCRAGCHQSASYPSEAEMRPVSPIQRGDLPLQPSATRSLQSKPTSACLGCHDDSQAWFQGKAIHDPVRKRWCEECHLDHGLDNRLALRAPGERLCLRCHEGESESFREAHGGLRVAGSDCLACHDPHADDTRSLLPAFAHEPYGERSCGDCHDGEEDSWVIGRPVDEVCADCHDDVLDRASLHGASGKVGCTGCHDPHASPFADLLTRSEGPLCHRCHDRAEFSRQSPHRPAAEGKCDACHAVHAGRPKLLGESTGNELCLGCHDEEETSFRKRHQQLPVEGISCASCHLPHSSEKIHLLRPDIHRPLAYGKCGDCHREGGELVAKTTALLCFRCHEPHLYEGLSRHEPVADGDCTACHDPHGSSRPVLLTAAYPLDRDLPFSEEIFELCFSCHDTASFREAGPGAETAFKDRRVNYHYLHAVGADRGTKARGGRSGMTCRNCHLPHASLQPHLVRENIDCGEGVPCLRLAYAVGNGVGTCRAGCHQPASYPSGAGKPAAASAPGGAAAEAATGISTAPDSACLKCHGNDWTGLLRQYLHDPFRTGNCTACHLEHGPENSLILVSHEGRMCDSCHGETGKRTAAGHGGFDAAGSDCLECHDPHAADNTALLLPYAHEPYAQRSCDDCHDGGSGSWNVNRPVNEICLDCHEDRTGHRYFHGAIAKGSCLDCHPAHAGRHETLIREETPALCYRCHERQNFTQDVRHEPVEDGDCGSCHDFHGSENVKILLDAYPQARYQEYRPENYGLCFSCHDNEPFTEASASGTGFRNGDVNLHYLHVNEGATRGSAAKQAVAGCTCRNCHDPHSTAQPALVRRKMDCGGVFCLNLVFRKSGDKGHCSRGCHRSQAYVP